jgi:hypothetical protein
MPTPTPPITRCPACRVKLNIPPQAGHRRLRCPNCATRFHPNAAGAAVAPASPSAPARGTPPTPPPAPRPSEARRGNGRPDLDGIPLLEPDDDAGDRYAGAAEALFRDDPEEDRRVAAAEARMRPRICPDCTATVPRGMSLCRNCGLDLDTGRRLEPEPEEDEEEVWDVAMPRYHDGGMPFGVIAVGGVSLLVSVVLFVLTLVNFGQTLGGYSLAFVCLFGAFASYQFLVGRSARPLLVALILGGLIDVVGLIALPVLAANMAVPGPAEVEAERVDPAIPSIRQRLDTGKITLGVVLLVLDTVALIYLSTAGVRDHFEEEEDEGAIPI